MDEGDFAFHWQDCLMENFKISGSKISGNVAFSLYVIPCSSTFILIQSPS